MSGWVNWFLTINIQSGKQEETLKKLKLKIWRLFPVTTTFPGSINFWTTTTTTTTTETREKKRFKFEGPRSERRFQGAKIVKKTIAVADVMLRLTYFQGVTDQESVKIPLETFGGNILVYSI